LQGAAKRRAAPELPVGNEDMTNTTLFLIITGTVIVAGCLVFKLLIKLYRKPILEINLSPLDNPRWSDTHKIAGLIDSFLRNGFEPAGNYSCWEIPTLMISGFVRPSEQIAGVIYDHPAGGLWVDVYVQYRDGGSLTVSNAPKGQELDHMPQQAKIYCKGNSVDELLKKLLDESKKAERMAITKEEFPSQFEDNYQKEMKWRMERGGPTYLEVMRVGNAMGESLDTERLQNATQKINETWVKEKNKPKKNRSGPVEFVLPGEFQRPEAFRLKLEQKSEPLPQLNVPALPVYLVFIAALAYWCYYGYQYNETHFPVSLAALIIFLSVFLVLFLIMMSYREYHRRVRMCPLLKRIADLRPGAFLVIKGSSPSLFYARERWIGKLRFREGSEHEDAFTRLDAITKHSMGSLTISRNSLLNKVIGSSDKDTIPLPESDFSRKFTVSGTDTEFAGKLLSPAISDAILRLEEFGRPFVEINHSLVGVEIEGDLSRPRKEAVLRKFLEEAERIIEATVQQAGNPDTADFRWISK
jgi:hypothetical protein